MKMIKPRPVKGGPERTPLSIYIKKSNRFLLLEAARLRDVKPGIVFDEMVECLWPAPGMPPGPTPRNPAVVAKGQKLRAYIAKNRSTAITT